MSAHVKKPLHNRVLSKTKEKLKFWLKGFCSSKVSNQTASQGREP